MRSIPARRLTCLPPYLFAELDRKRRETAARGLDIIDLGIGDPDLPTPEPIVRALIEAAGNPKTHRYPTYQGMPAFRETAARFMRERFGIDLDPQTEICALIGSKEGIAHAPLALVNPGETVLVPDPAYPVYRAGTMFAGGEPVDMPLREENGFLPDFQEISDETAERASVMFLNYPNNPTGATVDENFFDQAVDFAATHDLTVLHDAAYSELCFADYRAPSILQVPSAKERCVEFHSLSKTFNMTGWRLGFVAGNAQVVGAIGRVKTNIDSGVFEAVQQAGIAAYSLPEHVRRDIAAVYRPRRDVVLDGLRRAGIAAPQVRATFYVWFPVPGGDSTAFASRLLEKTGGVVTPGVGFGPHGEGYVRIALCAPEERLAEAMERIVRF